MKPIKKGECDACPKIDVDLFQSGNMLLCASCYAAEVKAIDGTKWINNAIANGRVIERPIELKQEIFNSSASSFIMMQMEIQADASIPQNKKTEVFLQRIEAKQKELSDAIFAEKAITAIKENERYSISQQTREFIAKLQVEEREKFKKYDVSYAPKTVSPKKIKDVAKDKSPRKPSFDKKACLEAAKKYGVAASTVQSIYFKKPGISYDAAAKMLAQTMGLIPEDE